PRAGIDSEAYEKAVDVWCSDDRKQAMTDAKNGLEVNAKHCDSPVAQQYQLGRQLGVNGTPSLFLADGTMLPGYVPPKKLKRVLDQRAAEK
ncbi:MAG: DsbC family protein, partial [Gammaproteobacteria bacterium]